MVEGLVGQPYQLRDLSQRQLLTLELVVDAVTPVVVLLGVRRPPAIPGLVVAVGIDPVQGRPKRAWPHVFNEVVEVRPAVAVGDAATTVVLVARVIGVVTTRLHRAPGVVRGRAGTIREVPLRVSLSVYPSKNFRQQIVRREGT
jgi:hypothetical protein